MEHRVFGLETEYGFVVSPHPTDSERIEATTAASVMFAQLSHLGMGTSHFLPNGARCYLDVGCHPEYATPECTDAFDLVAAEAAGDQIVSDLACETEEILETRRTPARIHLVKNNTDDLDATFGSHENYLLERSLAPARYLPTLLSHLATRIIYTAAGCVRTGSESGFVLSERARHLVSAAEDTTTRARPLVSTRDEPHADRERFRRLHVIAGDSTMTERSSFLRFATTHLVLRLIEEHPHVLPGLALERPVVAVHAVRTDLTFASRIERVGGHSTSALAFQRRLHDAVATHCDLGDRLADKQALIWWDEALTALESSRRSPEPAVAAAHSQLGTQLDWPVKLRLLHAWRVRHSASWDHPTLRQLDIAFHNIHPTRGLIPRLSSRGLLEHVVSRDAIETACTTAPPTRARVRAALMLAAAAEGLTWAVGWDRFALTRRDPRAFPQVITCVLPDPFDADISPVDDLLELIRAGG